MPQPSDPSVPEITVYPPALSRDEAAAAWFVQLEAVKDLLQSDKPSGRVIGKATLHLARGTAATVRGLSPAMLAFVIKENCRSEIIT